MSFTDAPLIGEGDVGRARQLPRLLSDKLFFTSINNNGYFVLLTVIPTTVIALVIALMVNRLKGRLQALVLVIFFLPYILPVSVVTEIWLWMLDFQYGVLQPVIAFFTGKPVAVLQEPLLGDADGRRRHDLVDQRLQRAALPRRSAQHPAGALRGRRPRRRHAAPAVLARDLAAALAGHGAGADAAAHPAAQALRPGLPDDPGRTVQLVLRAAAASSTARPSSSTTAATRAAIAIVLVVHHRGHLGAAVPAPAHRGPAK